MARAAPALSAPKASLYPPLLRKIDAQGRRGAATEIKHLCPSRRDSRDFSPEHISGS